ncbi:10262_t:CDS:2 [Acaulospora morrowiae]|uniref:10262_t:CDS:1 n=1 Tax=Acaulospora morrowiae TaxID=94023 RepID=A0A9N9AHW6_9GLOM|nr:10262_t:CDS:2 [Acaulospora morrowiae]
MSFLKDIKFYVHLFNILELIVSTTCLVFESIFINAFLIYNPNVDSSSYYNILTKPAYQCFFGTAVLFGLLDFTDWASEEGLIINRANGISAFKWLSELSQPISLNITDPKYRYGLNVFARIGYSCYIATICLGFGNAIFYVVSAVLVFHWRKNMYSVVDKDEVQSVVNMDEIPNASAVDRDH